MALTLKIAFASWLVLLAGVVSFLRAAGIGRLRLELITVVAIACLPMTWMCVASFFHPEDLMALGLCLAAIACAIRRRWMAAGVLVAVGALTQQYSLLVAVPLLVLAPAARRRRYAEAAVVTWALTGATLLLITSGTVAHALIFGTGTYGTTSGGTLLWELHISGSSGSPFLFLLLARVAPLAIAAVLARWLVTKLGHRLWTGEGLVAVVALIAVSITLRLVFEQVLLGYFFLAPAVTLLLLDIIRGRMRASTVAWLFTVALVYCAGTVAISVYPHPWSGLPLDVLKLTVVIVSVAGLAFAVTRRRLANCGIWLIPIVVAVTSERPVSLTHHVPLWIWQILLVSWALALGVAEMVRAFRTIRATTGNADLEGLPSVDAESELTAGQIALGSTPGSVQTA